MMIQKEQHFKASSSSTTIRYYAKEKVNKSGMSAASSVVSMIKKEYDVMRMVQKYMYRLGILECLQIPRDLHQAIY